MVENTSISQAPEAFKKSIPDDQTLNQCLHECAYESAGQPKNEGQSGRYEKDPTKVQNPNENHPGERYEKDPTKVQNPDGNHPSECGGAGGSSTEGDQYLKLTDPFRHRPEK
jgi:hypothetical protein